MGNNVRPLLEKIYDVITVGLTQQDNYTVNIAREVPALLEHYDIVLHAAKASVLTATEAAHSHTGR